MVSKPCVIYKGSRKAETYLFIEREDEFQRVPEALLGMLGELTKVMQLELSAERQLAQADVQQVMQLLDEQGFYLQLPPENDATRDVEDRLKY